MVVTAPLQGLRASKLAFTLFECMLYGALLAPIGFIALVGVHALQRYLQSSYNRAATVVQSCALYHILRRDVMGASCNHHDWVIDSSYSAWKKTTMDVHGVTTTVWVGWHYHDHVLRRYEGTYDITSNGWIAKSSSIITHALTHWSVQLEYRSTFERVKTVKCLNVTLQLCGERALHTHSFPILQRVVHHEAYMHAAH